MKRFLTIAVVLVACLALSAPVMARGGFFSPKVVTSDVEGQAVSSDSVDRTSGFFRPGDDGASAGGSSYGYFASDAFGAVLWGGVSADTFGVGNSRTDAFAISLDIFNFSTSMAGASTESSAYTTADVNCRLGLFSAESYVEVAGIVSQGNYANEVNNPGAMASAGNSSTAEYYGDNRDRDLSIFGGAHSDAGIQGGAQTVGSSTVIVDPYGHNRSAFATTQNCASAYQTGNGFTRVSGNGSVSALSQNGNNFAGANGSFSYNGSGSGQGSSTVNTNVHTHGNSSTVTASGHSEASTGR